MKKFHESLQKKNAETWTAVIIVAQVFAPYYDKPAASAPSEQTTLP